MAHRACEDCGASMAPFVRRTRREDGSLVCRACLPEERGGRRGGGRPEATPKGYRSPQHWESAKHHAMPFDDNVDLWTPLTPGSQEHLESVLREDNVRRIADLTIRRIRNMGWGPEEFQGRILNGLIGAATMEAGWGKLPLRIEEALVGKVADIVDREVGYGSRTSAKLPDRFPPLFEGRHRVAQGGTGPFYIVPYQSGQPPFHGPILAGPFSPLDYERAFDLIQEGDYDDAMVVSQDELARWVIEGRKVAHDSGDGETIYHCPFCGAGQVVGNSDGTAQCGFCNTTFSVQVQPNQPEMPQTVEGEPYDIPDMPGEPRGGDSGLPPPPVEEETPVPIEEEAKQPPQQPPQFATSSGRHLDEGDYIAHLALRHTRNREATLRAIRAQRGS